MLLHLKKTKENGIQKANNATAATAAFIRRQRSILLLFDPNAFILANRVSMHLNFIIVLNFSIRVFSCGRTEFLLYFTLFVYLFFICLITRKGIEYRLVQVVGVSSNRLCRNKTTVLGK